LSGGALREQTNGANKPDRSKIDGVNCVNAFRETKNGSKRKTGQNYFLKRKTGQNDLTVANK